MLHNQLGHTKALLRASPKATFVVLVASVSLTIFTTAALARNIEVWFDLFSHFRAQYLFIGLILVCLALMLNHRCSLLLAGGSTMINGLFLVIQSTPPFEQSFNENELSIASFNVQRYTDNISLVSQYLQTSPADIVFLSETNKNYENILKKIYKNYPYQATCIKNVKCELAILSKLKFDSVNISFGDLPNSRGELPPHITVNFYRYGRRVTIIGTRIIYPVTPAFARLQERQLRQIAKVVRSQDDAVILIGDFNTTQWSGVFKRFEKLSNLRRVPNGLRGTWPTSFWPLRIAIDHTFVGGRISSARQILGPDLGSDHLPIVTDVVISE